MLKRLNLVIIVIALVMVAYHLFYSQASTQYHPYLHQDAHLTFALILVFLGVVQKKPKLWPLMLALILASLVIAIYILAFFDDLEWRAGYPTVPDIIISVALMIIVLIASRLAFGFIIPVIALIFLAYLFLGQYLPGPLSHIALSPARLISWLGVGFSGIFGTTAVGVSAQYLFMFVVFGGVMRVSGVIPFFIEVGKLAGRRMVGGAAQTAVVSSALVGSITGSSIANVAITGSFTIPLMKKMGHRPAEAGAIEATASSGGQILPPIMGVSAFMMAAITDIPYWSICLAAFIPALFYFFSVGAAVELRARKAGISPSRERLDTGLLLRRALIFIIPLGVITILLAKGFTPQFVGTWAIIAVFVTPQLLGLITKERPRLREWVEGFSQGAIDGSRIAVTSGAIGMIIASVITTGLGVRLSTLVEMWSQGQLWIALLFTMFVSLIIGCGVPTFPAYILVAILVVPALVKMGVMLLAAHLFCFYFAVFSAVTPPVATAALPASALSGATYMRTATEAFKIAVFAFIIPYVFVYNQVFLAEMSAPLFAVVSLVALLLAILAMAAAIAGQFMTRLSWLGRAFAGIGAAALVGSAANAYDQSYSLLAIGAGLFAIFLLWQLASKRRTQVVS